MNPIDPATVPATLEELLDLVGTHCRWIDTCLADPHTSWTPAVAVLLRGEDPGRESLSLFSLAVPFNEHAEKVAALMGVGRKLFADRQVPAAAVMSSEAWTAPDEGPGKLPADHPERQECIVVAGSSLGGKYMVLRMLPVTRGEGDRIVPGLWRPTITDGVETRLLNRIWGGYFEHVIQKFGWPGDKK